MTVFWGSRAGWDLLRSVSNRHRVKIDEWPELSHVNQKTAADLKRFLDGVGEVPSVRPDQLQRLREMVFVSHTGVRQQAIRALGVVRDIASAASLADVFAAGLDWEDHDYVFDAWQEMGAEIVPALLSAMPRLVPSVNDAVVCSVPPPNASCPGVAAPGTAPKAASAAMLSVPALIVVDPV